MTDLRLVGSDGADPTVSGPPLYYGIYMDPQWNDPQVVEWTIEGLREQARKLNRRLALNRAKAEVVLVFYDELPPEAVVERLDRLKEKGAYIYVVSRY